LILNSCAVITNRASIKRDINEHYVEIYGGGFTPESALLEELHNFTKLICGENRYHFKKEKWRVLCPEACLVLHVKLVVV